MGNANYTMQIFLDTFSLFFSYTFCAFLCSIQYF